MRALSPFDLDPCAAPSPRPWRTAIEHYELPQDGLDLPWAGRVWLNPPYGTKTGKWLEKMADHGQGTVLIFARTETDYWFDWIWPRAHAILFIRNRLNFYLPCGTRAKGNAGGPSALIAYGQQDADRLESSGINGAFVIPRNSRTIGVR